MKKILSLLSKVLFIEGVERHTHCVNCNKKLVGKQRKFCSDKCNNDYYRKLNASRPRRRIRISVKGGL